MNFTKEELEKQLANPEGKNGIEVAKNMNESNNQMTINSISSLCLLASETLLEIGHGNCDHLKKIFTETNDISYYGLEISETMKDEAERINKKLIKEKNVCFNNYNGTKIPFQDKFFDKIFSVNTIYFWKNPKEFISEIQRVLRGNGVFVLTFVKKDFMQNLSFVRERFSLYNNNDLKDLIKHTSLEITETVDKTEFVKSKTGDMVQREYTIMKIKNCG